MRIFREEKSPGLKAKAYETPHLHGEEFQVLCNKADCDHLGVQAMCSEEGTVLYCAPRKAQKQEES